MLLEKWVINQNSGRILKKIDQVGPLNLWALGIQFRKKKKMWDWNPSWTYVQFLWPGLWSDICWESLQACIQLWLFLCPVLNYKSFEMLQPNLNDLFLGVKTTFPMNGTFNFCQKRTYKGQIPDFLAKSGPFPDQFWSFSVIIFINLSTIIFQSSLTGKFIWVDQEHTNPEHFLAKILILAEDHNILLCPQLVWNLSNFLFLDLEIKIRRFSGSFWHFGPDPDQVWNSGHYQSCCLPHSQNLVKCSTHKCSQIGLLLWHWFNRN